MEQLGELAPRRGAVEVAADAQVIDVLVEETAPFQTERARARLGRLLCRMLERPAILEPISRAPGVDAILTCVRRQLTLAQVGGKTSCSARLWILAGGDPKTATRSLKLEPRQGWPRAFRFAPPALQTCVVVLPELPPGRDTLPLRLMGFGATFRRAAEEVLALPQDDSMRQSLVPLLHQRRFAALYLSQPRRTEEDMGVLREEFDKFQERLRQEGRDAGLREGRDAGLREGRDEGLREGRDEGLRAAVRLMLEARFGPLSAGALRTLERASGERLELIARRFATGAETLKEALASPRTSR